MGSGLRVRASWETLCGTSRTTRLERPGAMKRRLPVPLKALAKGLSTVGVAGLALAAAPSGAVAETASRPNIIVIIADDLGWGDLSCYPQNREFPDSRIRTPNLDSLAAQGVRFTQAYAPAMVCAPTRAGVLTGRYQQSFGFFAFEETMAGMPDDEVIMSELLNPGGYATGLIGKWHVGYNLSPLTRGFDRFFGFQGGQNDFFDPRLGDSIVGMSYDYHRGVLDQGKPVRQMDYFTHELTNQSLDFIREQARTEEPFFLYLAHLAPHPPLQAVWEDLEPWDRAREGGFNQRDIVRAMIKALDEGIGALLNELIYLDIDDNTLIFFTSDNGGHDDSTELGTNLIQHNGGLRGRKGLLYEGGIRVPFIMSWPGHVPEGETFTEPVSLLDIYPTVAAAAGAELPPKPLHGVNLLPYVNGTTTGRPHDVLYWGLDEHVERWAIRVGDWKLVSEFTGAQTIIDREFERAIQLFDLDSDPFERHDLSAQFPEKAEELEAKMRAFYAECPPSLATPEILEAAAQERERRERRLREEYGVEHPNHLRWDGAPGHWMDQR